MADAETLDSMLPLPPAVFHILLSLAEEDRHGYAILQDVAARTGGKTRLGPATLYRSIQRMLEQGLIEECASRLAASRDDERRRYYRITRLGASAARAEARRLAGLVALARESGLVPRRT
jgi:DNA-binding PadR family transcriptional regulator